MSWRGKAAVHALPNTLNKKAEGLLEPLLEGEEDDDSSASSDESSLYSSSTVSVQVKPTAMQWIKTAVGELLYSILTWYPIVFVWSGKCIDATALILFIYQPTYIIYIQFINFTMHIVTLGLGAGVAASAASIVFAPVVAVIVMSSILFANVPYAAYKEVRIIKLPGKFI